MDNNDAVVQGVITEQKIKKQKIYGIIFSITMIFISIFIFGGNRLVNKYYETRNYFYHIENELSIFSQVNFIWGTGHNMLVVASRYDVMNQYVQNLYNSLNMLTYGDYFDTSYNLNRVVNAMSILDEQREILGLDETDINHFDFFMADIESAMRIISNSDFNNRVTVFNDRVTSFSSNIIRAIRNIDLLPYF